MSSPRAEKKAIKKIILKALLRDGIVDEEVLLSSLRLETGFSNKVVAEILHDMINVGWIHAKDGKLTLTETGTRLAGEE